MNQTKTQFLLMIGTISNLVGFFGRSYITLEIRYLIMGTSIGFILSFFLVRYWISRDEAHASKQKSQKELTKLKKEFKIK